MLNKKGDISLKKIFEILIVVIVAAALLGNTYRISQADTYVLKPLAVDLSFEISALTGLKHDSNSFAAFTFPFETNVAILPNKVMLTRDKIIAEYYYSADPNIKIGYHTFENIKILYLTKSGNTLSFSADNPGSLNYYFCKKTDLNLNEVTFDPGKGFDEVYNQGSQGQLIDGLSESLHTLKLAALLRFEPDFKSTRPVHTTLKDSFMSVDDRKDKVSAALISVHAGEFEDDIKIYTNDKEESVILACNLMNALLKNLNPGTFTDFAIIPVNFEFILEDDFKQILNIEKPAVLLEIGTKFLADSKKEIVDSIIEGVYNV